MMLGQEPQLRDQLIVLACPEIERS